MPIFGSKFSLKKPQTRKSGFYLNEDIEELFLEDRTVPLKLSHQDCIFEKGLWSQDNEGTNKLQKSLQKLQDKCQQVQEENVMLKLRNAVLLNMLTQATVECHARQKEMESI